MLFAAEVQQVGALNMQHAFSEWHCRLSCHGTPHYDVLQALLAEEGWPAALLAEPNCAPVWAGSRLDAASGGILLVGDLGPAVYVTCAEAAVPLLCRASWGQLQTFSQLSQLSILCSGA